MAPRACPHSALGAPEPPQVAWRARLADGGLQQASARACASSTGAGSPRTTSSASLLGEGVGIHSRQSASGGWLHVLRCSQHVLVTIPPAGDTLDSGFRDSIQSLAQRLAPSSGQMSSLARHVALSPQGRGIHTPPSSPAECPAANATVMHQCKRSDTRAGPGTASPANSASRAAAAGSAKHTPAP